MLSHPQKVAICKGPWINQYIGVAPSTFQVVYCRWKRDAKKEWRSNQYLIEGSSISQPFYVPLDDWDISSGVYHLYLDLTINSSSDYRRSIPQKDLEVSEHILFNQIHPFLQLQQFPTVSSPGGGWKFRFPWGVLVKPKLFTGAKAAVVKNHKNLIESVFLRDGKWRFPSLGEQWMKRAPNGWLFSG